MLHELIQEEPIDWLFIGESGLADISLRPIQKSGVGEGRRSFDLDGCYRIAARIS
jgi:hypothetical protein